MNKVWNFLVTEVENLLLLYYHFGLFCVKFVTKNSAEVTYSIIALLLAWFL